MSVSSTDSLPADTGVLGGARLRYMYAPGVGTRLTEQWVSQAARIAVLAHRRRVLLDLVSSQ